MDDKDKNKGGAAVEEVEYELGEKELGQIAEKVGESLLPKLEAKMAESQDALVEKFAGKIEAIKGKDIKKANGEPGGEADETDAVAKGIKAGLFTKEIAAESKEMRLFKAAKALVEGDSAGLKQYNAMSLATRIKAGYANEGTVADGGALVPDAEFDTTVYENLPKYGVAFRDADVRQTDRTSVRFLSLDSGLQFYATAEAGVKRSAKLAFTKQLTDLLKYAVIVPSTDELADDAAIDFWNLVTKELSRAYAKLADEITFTDATSGITNTAGVITEATSGAGTTLAWDDLLSAEGKVEDDLDTSNFKWYMRKQSWFQLVQTKAAGDGQYFTGSLGTGWIANPNTPTTPWGTPVVFTRVLPSAGQSAGSPGVVGSNDAFAVFGDLQNYVLYNKRGMALKVLTEATILDSESTSFNLATQDGTAMRAVVRMLGKLPKGNASKFVILGTGTVS